MAIRINKHRVDPLLGVPGADKLRAMVAQYKANPSMQDREAARGFIRGSIMVLARNPAREAPVAYLRRVLREELPTKSST